MRRRWALCYVPRGVIGLIHYHQALKELEKIEETMHELLDTQAELKSHQAALEDLCNRIATGDQIVS